MNKNKNLDDVKKVKKDEIVVEDDKIKSKPKTKHKTKTNPKPKAKPKPKSKHVVKKVKKKKVRKCNYVKDSKIKSNSKVHKKMQFYRKSSLRRQHVNTNRMYMLSDEFLYDWFYLSSSRTGFLKVQFTRLGSINTAAGVLMDNLPYSVERILRYSKISMRNHDNHRFMKVLIDRQYASLMNIKRFQPIYDKRYNKYINYHDYKISLNFMDWVCCYCKNPIKVGLSATDMGAYYGSNFTCSECYKKIPKNDRFYNENVVKSSYAFTKYYKDFSNKRNNEIVAIYKKNNLIDIDDK